jgi:ubiquinol-cytochrome c reductase cytochrome b subunit
MRKHFNRWLRQRLPVDDWSLKCYFLPRNLNLWYLFGSLALVVFGLQILTGIFLTMHYTPTAKEAFASVQHIMREVNYGWLIRYCHTTGASFLFIVIYLHMFRSLLYGSYLRPRELVWLLGMLLYLAMLAEAFMGYLLPWGQMSYWGAQVITSLFSAIPLIGDNLVIWVRGDYAVADATLHRFFALHSVAIPMLMMFLVRLHLKALHHVGANNPTGIEQNAASRIPFHPYYTYQDLWGIAVFLIVFSLVVFFLPETFLEASNALPANPLQTPNHIAPMWYMTPFYAMLRAIPAKGLGVSAMACAIALLFVLPWLDRSSIRAIAKRSLIERWALAIFVGSFLSLAFLGANEVTPIRLYLARGFTLTYFGFFLLLPWYSQLSKKRQS